MSDLLDDITKLTPEAQAKRVEQDAAVIYNANEGENHSSSSDAAREECLKELMYLHTHQDVGNVVAQLLRSDVQKGNTNALFGLLILGQTPGEHNWNDKVPSILLGPEKPSEHDI